MISKTSIVPVQTSFLGAPSRRFRQQRLLIVGCGDVGLRVASRLAGHIGHGLQAMALSSQAGRGAQLRAKKLIPLIGNLDNPKQLQRLAGLATHVLHLAPPPSAGDIDTRTQHLIQALRLRSKPVALVYASTTGVYGNCNGQWVSETRVVNPQTDRARRRVDAEWRVRTFGKQSNVRVSSLRIPGIYAADRVGGDPLERVRQATPVLVSEDDVYTNHIHADDLARACIAALWRGKPQRSYNIAEDSGIKTGDYYDAWADRAGLPRPPRITRDQALLTLSPMRLSFFSESRRIDNSRMKRELGIALNQSSLPPARDAGMTSA
ncbi:MAG: SDR family oxidoreductase [Cytophagales bacterium]|nr:SDR family oxidoreductase [Cytophagales bacterium]